MRGDYARYSPRNLFPPEEQTSESTGQQGQRSADTRIRRRISAEMEAGEEGDVVGLNTDINGSDRSHQINSPNKRARTKSVSDHEGICATCIRDRDADV
jgi:hypothetical protein